MSVERERTIADAMRNSLALNRAAKTKNTRRKEVTKPWSAFWDFWQASMDAKYGLRVKRSEWNAQERSLARKLIDEYGLEKAKRMAEAFIADWRRSGEFPPVAYLWTDRSRWAATVDGALRVGVARGEYDAALDGASPKHGW